MFELKVGDKVIWTSDTGDSLKRDGIYTVSKVHENGTFSLEGIEGCNNWRRCYPFYKIETSQRSNTFKVGDEVYTKGVIVEVDDADRQTPFKIRPEERDHSIWFSKCYHIEQKNEGNKKMTAKEYLQKIIGTREAVPFYKIAKYWIEGKIKASPIGYDSCLITENVVPSTRKLTDYWIVTEIIIPTIEKYPAIYLSKCGQPIVTPAKYSSMKEATAEISDHEVFCLVSHSKAARLDRNMNIGWLDEPHYCLD